jgi:penicillin-binding protein 2
MVQFNFEKRGRKMGLRNFGRVLSVVFLLTVCFFVSVNEAMGAIATGAASGARAKKRLPGKRAIAHSGRKSARLLAAGYTRTRTRTGVALTRTMGRRGLHGRHRVFFNPWTEPTFADSTIGDGIDGDDLVIRKAAADALGPYNGTIVVSDPQTGRILSIVNQKLALKGAFQPCSTVKVIVSFASLREAIVDANTPVQLSPRFSLDMTTALARSNNRYFAHLGEQLGFDRVEKYAKLFGLGEKAGYDIAGEEPGYLATQPPSTGVGMMTSFGDGIRLTALELTSIVTAVANGGTMYYLQYPKNQDDIEHFVPRVRRELDIARFIPEIRPGMMGAVEYGTARRAKFDQTDPVLGKTGTCTDTAQPGVHLGWFGSFNEVGRNRIVVVVLLTGGRGVAGPVAAKVAGDVYRNLAVQNYFGPEPTTTPTKLVSMQNCCRQ